MSKVCIVRGRFSHLAARRRSSGGAGGRGQHRHLSLQDGDRRRTNHHGRCTAHFRRYKRELRANPCTTAAHRSQHLGATRQPTRGHPHRYQGPIPTQGPRVRSTRLPAPYIARPPQYKSEYVLYQRERRTREGKCPGQAPVDMGVRTDPAHGTPVAWGIRESKHPQCGIRDAAGLDYRRNRQMHCASESSCKCPGRSLQAVERPAGKPPFDDESQRDARACKTPTRSILAR
ncbi:hypothetical protein OH76DRAFT_360795 [Lentinus brumalis]|uniref:Uncharacterized protein n=1 Tax=Lentinus brumalis TaxID=2498619 RepID=A0A371CJ69_9APHY|nr:hypothetical protein OH76DRAFT_360795 [Polyporus brumalis]